MTQYDNSNRGAIWKNDDKQNDNHPDFKGSQNVCCAKCGQASDYWVSAWKRKEGAAAKAPALSFSVKPKDVQTSISTTIRNPDGSHSERVTRKHDPISSGLRRDDLDDAIPF